jgi:hypothetical protein
MADRRREAELGVLCLCACLLGCDAEEQTLLLDTICRGTFSPTTGLPATACTTTGDVELVTGVSDDVTGVHFGSSGRGELRLRINAIAAANQGTWSFEVLAAASRPESTSLFRTLTWGSCGATCPADPPDIEAEVTEDFAWLHVVDDSPGSNFSQSFVPVPDDAQLVFRGADIDLVDVRTPGFDPSQPFF